MDGAPDHTVHADPARVEAARREVEAFAREKGAAVIDDGPGRWRVERKPAVFKLGVYRWVAELKPDGGLSLSGREWRPDPKYG
jgi:hypothetical protein